MEKELFLTTLKGKAQVDNLSDRTYDEVAALWLPSFADDSKITDESWNIPVQMLKTMSGQLRHDVSVGIASGKNQWELEASTARQKAIDDAVAAAKTEWEKSTKSAPDDKPGQQPEDLDAKVAAAVAKAMAGVTGEDGTIGKLSKQLNDFLVASAAKEKAQTEAEIRSQIRSHLISRGVDEDDYALEITMEKLAIGENPDVAALSAKAEKDYEAIYKRMHKGEGAQPFAGGIGGDGAGGSGGAAAWLKSRAGIAEEESAAAEARKKLLR